MSLAVIQDDIRREADKDEFQRFMVINAGRGWRALALDWLGIALMLYLCSRIQTWWMFAITFVWIGIRQYAIFILGHDAIHGSLHPNIKVNDSIARWLIHGPMFMGFEDGRRNHLEHHKLLGIADDPDRYLHMIANKRTPCQFLLFCSGLATFGRTVIKVTPFGKLAAQSREQSPEPGSLQQVMVKYARDRVPVAVAQVLIVSTFLALGLPWWSYPLLWIAPVYFFVFVPDEIRAFAEHAVLSESEDLADDKRLVTFRPSWFEAAIFSPHNMNYHAEHHLWPRVPYYSLPKVAQALDKEAGSAFITIRNSYIMFLADVLGYLAAKR